MNMNDLRAKLISAIDDVQSGQLESNDARSIVGLAGQINQSINVELKAMKIKRDLGLKTDQLGKMGIS